MSCDFEISDLFCFLVARLWVTTSLDGGSWKADGELARQVDSDHGASSCLGKRTSPAAYFVLARDRCASAEPAALFDAALVRPSRRTADAAVAAFADVAFAGATCASALPAARFEATPVDGLLSTDEDLAAALLPVTLLAMWALMILDVLTVSRKRFSSNSQHREVTDSARCAEPLECRPMACTMGSRYGQPARFQGARSS